MIVLVSYSLFILFQVEKAYTYTKPVFTKRAQASIYFLKVFRFPTPTFTNHIFPRTFIFSKAFTFYCEDVY